MNTGEKFKEERNRLSLSQSDVAHELGMDYKVIGRWEKGADIGSGKISALQEMGFNMSYVLFDKSADVGTFENKNSIKSIAENSKTAGVGTFNAEKYAFIPLYDIKVSAGDGAYADEENVLTRLAFTNYSLRRAGLSPEHLSCVTVTGDSMFDTIRPGDTIMINHKNTRADGGVFVLRYGDTLHIKRLIAEKDTIRVISDNPIYPEWTLSEGDDFEVIGKKVWMASWD